MFKMPANTTEAYLSSAVDAVRRGGDWRTVLDAFQMPIYTTDAEGAVTYWNQACVELAGREPTLGSDRWCVTWKLHTISGEELPHDQCPMARAIRERREVYNEIIIAERPDGRRIACRPYPTPFFNEAGELAGAVNLIVAITSEQSGELLEQAERCRRLAQATTDRRTADILSSMADGYASTADDIRNEAH
jgi:PAS domain-containing protein